MKYLTILTLLALSAQAAPSPEIHLQKKCECGRTVHLTLRKVEKKDLVRVKRTVVRVKPKVCVVSRKVKVRVKTEAERAAEQAAK